MEFNWRSPVFPRVAIMAATLFIAAFFTFSEKNGIYAIIFLAISAYLLKNTLDLIDRSANKVSEYLENIRFDDVTYSFKSTSNDLGALRLQQMMNDALRKVRQLRHEKDSEFLFFKNIVMHAGIGLLVFRTDGTIEIFNSAARKLLKVTRAEKLSDLRVVSDPLVDMFEKLKTGGRELMRLKLGEDIIQLSIYCIELNLRNENVKLISLANIQSELEEKEMEAWQNLVRVLTHEIMNSVTPISSLAGTIEEELKPVIHEGGSLNPEQLADIHLSLQTISKRSGGLIQFVREFRSLTAIPKPKPVQFPVKVLLEELTLLHRNEIQDRSIEVSVQVYPTDLTVVADRNMIEQVVINLLKNAIQAFEEQPKKSIELKAYLNEKSRPVIAIRDNGPGIDPDAMEKIFIPFFTTKKTGSGIGLSLSRQIMRQHQGTLSVKSEPGMGTEFVMRF